MPAPADEQTLTARWVFPVSGPPIPNGTVTVCGSLIAAVHPAGARTADVDLGNAAIIPGLVNAHTHLDLSGMHGKVPPSPDFVGWLRDVIAYRRGRTPDRVAADVRKGLGEALHFGTTLLGDIAAGGSSWDALAAAPVWAVSFHELLGLPAARVAGVWAEVVRWADDHPDTPTCRAGVSPHAPYSVHRSLIEAAARLWPLCIHLAESPAERQLLDDRTGPFVPFLRELGVWDSSGLSPSWDWVAWRASRAPAALLAHGNYLPAETPLAPNTSIVYCPRTHAAFGHPPHPFREWLARGVRVALGTDSLASNPDLDILAEARVVHARYPDFPGDRLLRMATLNGAEALGFGDRTGSLDPGKSADLVAVPLPDADGPDPFALLFGGAAPDRPRRTMWRGAWRTVALPSTDGPT
jgi:aminodeoxyfutalosine deaminase